MKISMIEKIGKYLQEGKLKGWNKDFSLSVLKQLKERGELSEKQWNCIKKIISTQENPEANKPDFLKNSSNVGSMGRVVSFISRKKGFPKMWFKLPNGNDLCIYKATDRSKYAGQFQLTGGGYGSAYYGRITANGELFVYPDGKQVEDDLKELLTKLGNDPSRVASEFGKLTGSCSFCNRKLTDERSKAVGYGATCASNYDLEWGKKECA